MLLFSKFSCSRSLVRFFFAEIHTSLISFIASEHLIIFLNISVLFNITFSQMLDATLAGSRHHSELSRISVKLNGSQLPTYALNDILVSHPCPATVSRFSLRYFFLAFPLKVMFSLGQF